MCGGPGPARQPGSNAAVSAEHRALPSQKSRGTSAPGSEPIRASDTAWPLALPFLRPSKLGKETEFVLGIPPFTQK